jgi:hypothetical protein
MRELATGIVYVNAGTIGSEVQLPFGGTRGTGNGAREAGQAALDTFSECCAILFGLLPIMWSPTWQAGADVMKRIAAPMIGGVITSAILELLLYSVIFVI